MRARRWILERARRRGLEPHLRRVQDAVAPWYLLRARRDDANLEAMMAVVLRHDSNCIDIGANAGDILAMMTQLAPDGGHVAYEPLPDLAGRLAARFPRVDVHNAAAAAEPGEAVFYRAAQSDAESGLQPTDGSDGIPVRLEALDQSLPGDYAPHFVKIDVEGAELGVLQGGMEILRRHRPYVAFEHGSRAGAYGTTHRMIHDLLAGELGMRIFDMDGDGPLSAERFDRVADPPGRRWNFIACP